MTVQSTVQFQRPCDLSLPPPLPPPLPTQRTAAHDNVEPLTRAVPAEPAPVAVAEDTRRPARLIVVAEAAIALTGVTVGSILDSRILMLLAVAWAGWQFIAFRSDLRVGWQLLRRTLRRANVVLVASLLGACLLVPHPAPVALMVTGLVLASVLLRIVVVHLMRGRRTASLRVLQGPLRGGRGRLHVPELDDAAITRIAATAKSSGVHQVVLAPELVDPDAVRRLSWRLEEAKVALILGLEMPGTPARRLAIEPSGEGVRVLPGAWRDGHNFLRSFVDRAVAGLLLVLLSPLFAAIALAIRLDSQGKAIFVQTRVGQGGSTFRLLKFRTMYPDAEQRLERLLEARAASEPGNAVLFKMRKDPRVTRVGRALRLSSLDELPQLVNVVRGEMSLIGPRPALPREVEQYDEVARRRLVVKPGITGLWQVSGRSNLSWKQSVDLDVDYVDNWSATRDVAIALRTVKAVVTRDGAY